MHEQNKRVPLSATSASTTRAPDAMRQDFWRRLRHPTLNGLNAAPRGSIRATFIAETHVFPGSSPNMVVSENHL